MILLDTSGVFAALVGTEVHHERARRAIALEQPPFVLSPFVLAEVDYLLLTRVDIDTELRFLAEVGAGAYELAPIVREDVAAAVDLVERYRDPGIGLTDASIVVLANRFRTDRILTLDQRHFRAVRTLDGRPFVLLPADA